MTELSSPLPRAKKRINLLKGFNSRKGFTLVELLVAMSITSIIILVLFAIVGQTSTTYRFAQRKISTLSDSRTFLQFVESEFGLRISQTKFHWLNDTPTSSRVAFSLTRSSQETITNPTQGDVITVVYYHELTPDDGQRSSFKVFRKTLDGAATQQLLDAGDSAAFPATDSATDEAVLYNCPSFTIKPMRRNAQGQFNKWLPSDPLAPDAVELTIEIIDEFSSQKLINSDQWLALATSTDPRTREAVQRFTRLIPLIP